MVIPSSQSDSLLRMAGLVTLVAICMLAPGSAAAEGEPVTAAAPSAAPPTPNAVTGPTAGIKLGEALLLNGKNTFKDYSAAIDHFKVALGGKLETKRRAYVYARMAETIFRKGDLSQKEARKLKFYKLGQAEAEAGLKLHPDCVPCLFWRLSNLGRWGETRGIIKSLFLLPEVRSGFERCLKLDPTYANCILALAIMDVRVPGFAGGDTDRARKNLDRLLKQEPNHTRALIELALWYEDDGDDAMGIAFLKKVIAHDDPRYQGEWRKFDVPRAKRLLKKWQ